MKELVPTNPNMLCQQVPIQTALGNLELAVGNQEANHVRKVIKTSQAAEDRGIVVGDLVVTRGGQFPEMPRFLTSDDEVPVRADETYEILDPAQVVAIYRTIENPEDLIEQEAKETIKIKFVDEENGERKE